MYFYISDHNRRAPSACPVRLLPDKTSNLLNKCPMTGAILQAWLCIYCKRVPPILGIALRIICMMTGWLCKGCKQGITSKALENWEQRICCAVYNKPQQVTDRLQLNLLITSFKILWRTYKLFMKIFKVPLTPQLFPLFCRLWHPSRTHSRKNLQKYWILIFLRVHEVSEMCKFLHAITPAGQIILQWARWERANEKHLILDTFFAVT